MFKKLKHWLDSPIMDEGEDIDHFEDRLIEHAKQTPPQQKRTFFDKFDEFLDGPAHIYADTPENYEKVLMAHAKYSAAKRQMREGGVVFHEEHKHIHFHNDATEEQEETAKKWLQKKENKHIEG